MEPATYERLQRQGAQRQLAEGGVGIAVSLQYLPDLQEPSRPKRKRLLSAKFQELASSLEEQGGSWAPESLSVSGQTVEAVLPAASYDSLVKALETRQVRVDPLTDRQVVQPV